MIETSRLILRPWTKADLPELIRISNTETAMVHLGVRRRRGLDFEHPTYAQGHPLRPHITYVAERPRRAGP